MFQAAHLAFGFIHVHGARGGFLLFLAVVAVVALGVIMVVTSDKSK
jgi:hypothetical protein